MGPDNIFVLAPAGHNLKKSSALLPFLSQILAALLHVAAAAEVRDKVSYQDLA